MDKINALTMQQTLRERESVSVPWLQQTFGLSYREAKEMAENLAYRGWIGEKPAGVFFPVIPENLKLRPLERKELDTLFSVYSGDCNTAMAVLQEKGSQGASFAELSKRVRSDADTDMAMTILTGIGLAYEYKEIYFSCIPANGFCILEEMLEMRRRESRRRAPDPAGLTDEIREALDRIFAKYSQD